MEVKVENLEGLERKLIVTVPADTIDAEAVKQLEELSGKVKISGFRPGKVPFAVVKQRYGSSIRRDVVAKQISGSYFKALEQEKLEPAGQPYLEPKESQFGEPLEYSATFEVYPEFTLTELQEVELEKTVSEVTAEDVEDAVEALRKQHAVWEDSGEPAKDGDQLVVDFSGTVKGEEFKGGAAKEFKFELGAGSMLPDFETNLEGVEAGKEISFKLKFPKDYSGEEVAGKKAEFTVKVHKVLAAKLPELTDEFLEKMGIKEGGAEKLKERLKQHMERELKGRLSNKYRKQVLDKLLELNPIELPKVLIDQEIVQLQQQMKQQYAKFTNKKPEELPDYPREQFEKEAARRVHLGLLLTDMVKRRDTKVAEDEIKAKVMEMAGGYEKPEEFVSWYCEDKQRMQAVESVLLETKIIEELENQIMVTERKISFEEATKPETEE